VAGIATDFAPLAKSIANAKHPSQQLSYVLLEYLLSRLWQRRYTGEIILTLSDYKMKRRSVCTLATSWRRSAGALPSLYLFIYPSILHHIVTYEDIPDQVLTHHRSVETVALLTCSESSPKTTIPAIRTFSRALGSKRLLTSNTALAQSRNRFMHTHARWRANTYQFTMAVGSA